MTTDKNCMKTPSFHDILKEKMAKATPSAEAPASSTPEMFFDISPLFQVSLHLPKLWKMGAYPSVAQKKTDPAVKPAQAPKTLTPPPEPVASKEMLSPEECSQWNLFEKVMNCSLGTVTSRGQVKAAFRAFAKRNHPDTSPACDPKHFAYGVKVKNELMITLEKHFKSASSQSDATP